MMPTTWRQRVALAVLTEAMVLTLLACTAAPATTTNETIEPEVAVTVGTLTRTTLRAYVTAYGVIEPEPPREGDYAGSAKVTSRVAGVVAEVRCREGERVAKGAVVFRLDGRAIDVEIERARQAVSFADQQYDRQRRLLEVEGTAMRQVQEAEQQLAAARNALAAAETQRSFLDVTAPLAGILTRIDVRPGEAVDATRVLADIVDPARLVVAARVPTPEIARVAIGQAVEIEPNRSASSASAPSPSIVSTVTYIDSALDPATDTVLVRARLPERAFGMLRPGQFVTARVVVGECRDCLAAPIESVTKDEAGRTVLALVSGNVAEQRTVDVGLRSGELVEVRGDGLAPGQAIVTTGAYGLPARTRIRASSR